MQIAKLLVILSIIFNSLSCRAEVITPQMQVNDLTNVVHKISTQELIPYLARDIIIQKQNLTDMPYILGFAAETNLASKDDIIYVKGLNATENTIFDVVSMGKDLTDPEGKEYLGTIVNVIAKAKLLSVDKISQLRITTASTEVQAGYSIMPSVNFDLPEILYATYPKNVIQGKILTVLNGLENKGQYATVILNVGLKDKVQVGNLLNIVKSNREMVDTSTLKRSVEQLPADKFGEVLLYRVYDKVSLGIILSANEPVLNLDVVTN